MSRRDDPDKFVDDDDYVEHKREQEEAPDPRTSEDYYED